MSSLATIKAEFVFNDGTVREVSCYPYSTSALDSDTAKAAIIAAKNSIESGTGSASTVKANYLGYDNVTSAPTLSAATYISADTSVIYDRTIHS